MQLMSFQHKFLHRDSWLRKDEAGYDSGGKAEDELIGGRCRGSNVDGIITSSSCHSSMCDNGNKEE